MGSPLKDKSFAFTIRIVNLYKYLCLDKKEYVLSKQLLRSGTAIGALVREAEYGESKPDFIHKLAIALKEANETEYWILLLCETEYLTIKQCESITEDLKELLKLLRRFPIKTIPSKRVSAPLNPRWLSEAVGVACRRHNQNQG